MHLTQFTDFSLRALIYIGTKEGSVSLNEISSFYKISRNHLIKAVNLLEKNGYIQTKRGVGGGIKLAKPASEINIGEVIKCTEPNFTILECFDAKNNTCKISSVCNLKKILIKATNAFINELSKHTLSDLITNKTQILRLLNTDTSPK
jgi:Rrf2 family nitric oxide-sensitive transcriptional repressor